jgi:DNA modification methylase
VGGGVTFRILEGDCIEQMRTLDAESVQTCITSPPYYGLRDYGHDGQIGLEPTPDAYVERMVDVFREVRRVLRDDGTLWLNIGDSYAGSWGNYGGQNRGKGDGQRQIISGSQAPQKAYEGLEDWRPPTSLKIEGVKPKDLLGIPWLLAFALRADGWYLRSDIIWHKPNPMPESIKDRPTSAHEHIFLLAKSQRYFYDAEAIKEQAVAETLHDFTGQARVGIPGQPDHKGNRHPIGGRKHAEGNTGRRYQGNAYEFSGKRNKRNVWTVTTQPFPGAHFAVFPPKLIEPCVLAGSAEGDAVLDPFAGSGTTGLVALRHSRTFIGCELNPEYAQMARERIYDDAPLLNVEAA